MNLLHQPASTLFTSGNHDLRNTSTVAEEWSKWQRRRGQSGDVVVSDQGQVARSPKLARLEAALFVADRALNLRKLVQVATLADTREAQQLVDELNASYAAAQSAWRIEQVAAGYKLLTLPSLSKWIDKLHDRPEYMKLSPSAMETLSIIAYRQPCTRADVEAIRGVQAAEMIKQLMEKNLIRVVGEDDSLGRPYLYGTTKLFLESFGLTSLNQLPMADQLRPVVDASVADADGEEAIDAADGEANPSGESAAA